MGLLDNWKQYIKANTPTSTSPKANPATVIYEGLVNPNKYNVGNANRFKNSLFGGLGVVPGVGDVTSAVESADLFGRGEKLQGLLAATGALPMIPNLAGVLKPSAKLLWDAKEGMGQVPYNVDVDYFGFERNMPVSEFLEYAYPVTSYKPDSIAAITNQINEAKPLGQPFLDVRWNKENKVWEVWGHEGRHRAKVILDEFGKDTMIPVHFFPKDGLRSRNLTEEMLNAKIIPEKKVKR